MAYDERIRRNLGVWSGWIDTTAARWETLAKDWRGTSTEIDLAKMTVNAVRDQLIDNWDSWNKLWFETGDPLPSVIITGSAGSMNSSTGTATVGPLLTGIAMDGTTLEQLGGNEAIEGTHPAGGGNAGYSISAAGTYDGQVEVKMIDDVDKKGTYRGLIRYKRTANSDPEPLAWLFVAAN
jgi:hypothetical protein